MRDETVIIRTHLERTQHNEHSSALYLTSSYAFADSEDMRSQFAEETAGHIYSRYANPNVEEFITKMAILEKAEAGWATASGMAAVFLTFSSLLESGDHIVSSKSIFGSTKKLLDDILPRWKISSSYVHYDDYDGYEQAIQANTKIVYLETPSNPGLSIIDIARVASICKKKNVLLAIDNCFATPILQKPIVLGADIVIHSATKYLDGQGRTLGGVILANEELISKIRNFAKHSGPALSPFNAWILSKSLETLDVRMQRHCENAAEIAKRLEKVEAIKVVYYPFLESHPEYKVAKEQMKAGGGLISFELKGGLAAGKIFLDALRLFSLTANLGDVKSIATHPASTTHSKLSLDERLSVGITDGLVRLSIGLEHVEDIWNDLEAALQLVIE